MTVHDVLTRWILMTVHDMLTRWILMTVHDVLTRWILMTVQKDIMYFALGRTCTLVQSDHDTRCIF